MVVKQSTGSKAKTGAEKTSPSVGKAVAKKVEVATQGRSKALTQKSADVAGWIQDASLETSVASFGYQPKPGEREVEFSVAMRRRQEEGKQFAELRGRALIHAGGNVLALAEASYVAEMQEDEEEPRLVSNMYPALRDALQSLLELAGHTPPLPKSLEQAA